MVFRIIENIIEIIGFFLSIVKDCLLFIYFLGDKIV